jgi:hypothetical protein
MPVKVILNGKEELLQPVTEWQRVPVNTENSKLETDKNFYVASFNITE